MSEKEDRKLLVFYIDVRMIPEEEIGEFMSKIGKKAVPESFDGDAIMLPIYGVTKVECINPQYITDGELIRKNERLMAELHEHIENQLKNE